MPHLVRALGRGLIVGALVLLSRLSLNGQEKSDVLKYTIKSVPWDLQVDRMPGPHPPRLYQETFTFIVSNLARTDYAGVAPSCQTFDAAVMQTIPSGQTPVWVWSKGMSFCQAVTPVRIAAGQKWQKIVAWRFSASNVKDGKYKAIATFV